MTPTPEQRLEALYEGKSRPLVYGHRGAMAYAPMNTLPSFELAIEQGADGIELDVWLSQDDVPVVIHDFEVDKTTDGEGRVGSMPLEALKELDAGSWYDESFSGARIPTLDEVFETVGKRTKINGEIKSLQVQTLDVVWHTVECIKNHSMQDNVLVSSFNPLVLRQMRSVAPEIPIGYLEAPEIKLRIKLLLIGLRFHAWHPQSIQLTEGDVGRAHRRGRRVNTWTVNDSEEARSLRDMGVDMLITDHPDVILDALAE